jgi:hypothetical protein
MSKLFSLVYSLAATVLAGVALVTVMVAGWVSAPAIVGALGGGAVLAVPVALRLAPRIEEL